MPRRLGGYRAATASTSRRSGERAATARRLPSSAPQHREFPLIPFLVQARVALPAVGVDRTSGLDAILDERVQAGGRGVFYHSHPNPPNAWTIDLGGNDYENFTLGLPACDTLFQSTDHGFIHFDPALQPVPIRPDHRASQLMQPRPASFLTTQPQDALQPKSTGSVLLTRHIPHRAEPRHQRLPRVLENCACRRRGLSPARTALEQSGTNHDSLRPLTMRTSKAIWPPNTHQICSAPVLGRKPLFELLDGSRVIFHSPNLQVGVG